MKDERNQLFKESEIQPIPQINPKSERIARSATGLTESRVDLILKKGMDYQLKIKEKQE